MRRGFGVLALALSTECGLVAREYRWLTEDLNPFAFRRSSSIMSPTLRKLDGDIPLPTPSSALEEWYISVRDIVLEDLTPFDLARACRQRLYIEKIVPYALQTLRADPAAGELYDGELFKAMVELPLRYWIEHPKQADEMREISRAGYLQNKNKIFDIGNWLEILGGG